MMRVEISGASAAGSPVHPTLRPHLTATTHEHAPDPGQIGATLRERYGERGQGLPGAGALALGHRALCLPRGPSPAPPPAAQGSALAVRRLLAGAALRHRRAARTGGLRRQPHEPLDRGDDHPGALQLPQGAVSRADANEGGGGQRRAGVPRRRRGYGFLAARHPLLGLSSRGLARLACEIYAGNGIAAYLTDPARTTAPSCPPRSCPS